MDFSPKNFKECAKEALAVSSDYIRRAILGEVNLTGFLEKGDKTAVTVVDRESQKMAYPIIEKYLGNYRLNQEEANKESGNLNSNIAIYHDPLDGTGGFLIGGPTPTVILAAYDSIQKDILACATMEPITGRFWFSSAGEGAWLNKFDYHKKLWESKDGKQIHVNNYDISKNSHVLVDVNHAFSRLGGKRKILSKKGRRELTNKIEEMGAKEASFYTNGGHYALVATGRPTIVGNITTAIGGPFDIAGLLHVLEAGGKGNCYRLVDNEESRVLENIYHDIENADLVITGNSLYTLAKLKQAVEHSIKFQE